MLVKVPSFDEEVEIDYNYCAGYKGSLYKSNGDPGDPPEGAEVDILTVYIHAIDIPLNKLAFADIDAIETAIILYEEA